MAALKGGNSGSPHEQAVNLAEGQRQIAVAAAATQAAVRSAEITFYRAVVSSCRTNNGGNAIEPALNALHEIGVWQ
jgi:hypothetical protein